MEILNQASKLVQALNFAFREETGNGELIYRACQYNIIISWKRSSPLSGDSAPMSGIESLSIPYRFSTDVQSIDMPPHLIDSPCTVSIVLPINEGLHFDASFEKLPKSISIADVAEKAMQALKIQEQKEKEKEKSKTTYRTLGEYDYRKHKYSLKTSLLEDSPLQDMDYTDIQVYRIDRPNKPLNSKAPTTKAIINKFKESKLKK